MGLGRAFLVAGAQAVLVSVIPIRDQPTELLMRAFYHLLQYGWTAGLALQYAMHQVSVFTQYSPPHCWAAFHLLGRDVCVNLPPVRLAALPFHWAQFVPRTAGADLPLAFPRHDVFKDVFSRWFDDWRATDHRLIKAIVRLLHSMFSVTQTLM